MMHQLFDSQFGQDLRKITLEEVQYLSKVKKQDQALIRESKAVRKTI